MLKYNPPSQLVDRKVDSTALLSPPRSSSPSPIPLPNKQEREGYYFGLPSQPPLLARTSTDVWDPLGPDGCPKERVLGTNNHQKLRDMDWREQRNIMNSEIIDTLDAHGVSWTSVEFYSIGYIDEEWCNPVILFIGVCQGTLINEDGSPLPTAGKVAVACKRVLEKYDIFDVDCEIRESSVYHNCSEGEEPAKTSKSKRRKRPNRSRKY